MACFIVPATEAIVVTVATKVLKSKEQKNTSIKDTTISDNIITEDVKIPFSNKLKWLSNLLWGGAFLLAYEHVWHGEVVPWFPFLTAAGDPADAAVMLHEMATAGVMMAVFVTVAWVCMVLVSNMVLNREKKVKAAGREGIS